MLRVLDLFCGAAGGWSLGLHWTGGFTTVAACEADPERRAQFAQNFPGVPIYDDVSTLTAARLAADGIAVDVIAGSPPCQDASEAKADGQGVDGERTGLLWEQLRLVRELRPRWMALENVPGLGRRGLDRVRDALEEADYPTWAVDFGAKDVGANHVRERLVLIAANGGQSRRLAGRIRETTGRSWAELAGGAGDIRMARPVAGPWRQVTPDFHGVDDGLSPSLVTAYRAAYGDAFVPQQAHMIGRFILAAEQLLTETVKCA